MLIIVCLAFISTVASVGAALAFGKKRMLVDRPNARSSHTVPVPRLGGAAFVPVLVVALFGASSILGDSFVLLFCVLLAALVLYAVGLIDDVVSAPASIRFSIQISSAMLTLYGLAKASSLRDLDLLHGLGIVTLDPSYSLCISLILLVIWIVGVINVFNFMDGIDGMAGLQTVVAGLSWGLIGNCISAPFASIIGALVCVVAAAFLCYNWSPAKIFMGDSGSTVLGYFFAVLPLVAVTETRHGTGFTDLIMCGILVIWPFLADASFTVVRRLVNKENVLLPHRSHLYQRLVIARISHDSVTLLYGFLALIGSVCAWLVLAKVQFAILASLLFLVVSFAALWGRVRYAESIARRL